MAFRSLPRPSSPSSSKASTVDPCPLAISPIYPSLCPTTAVKTPSISGDIGGAPAFDASTPLSKIRRPKKDAQACTAWASVVIVSISSAAAGDTCQCVRCGGMGTRTPDLWLAKPSLWPPELYPRRSVPVSRRWRPPACPSDRTAIGAGGCRHGDPKRFRDNEKGMGRAGSHAGRSLLAFVGHR